MSLRNILTPRTKDWLDVNFNTLNAISIDVESGDQVVVNSAGIINCQGAPGTANQILTIDGSSNLNWEDHVIGEGWQSGEYHEATTFATTSGTTVLVTTATFTATGLNAGRYIIFYSAELENTAGASELIMYNDTDAVTYSTWYHAGAFAGFHNFSGMQIIVLTPGTKSFSFFTNSVTPGDTTTVQRVRYQLYRVA